jgi:selenocysteine lyase/cysteine desulfurase
VTLLDLSVHFSRFLRAAPRRCHLAAHSHHFWPDVAFDAQLTCWTDAARLADRKWETVLGEVMPAVRQGIAGHLSLPDPATIAFAPNTHELLLRVLSCLPTDRPIRILTSDSEFHSFVRQIARLEEDGLVTVERVPCLPLSSFTSRFLEATRGFRGDLVFISQVFFDSGAVSLDPQTLVDAVADQDTFVVVDGYHGYLARPTDLSGVANRVFYLAGGYKYAMAGEGACFLHCPPTYGARPRNTGWYASFGALSTTRGGAVDFSADGWRFAGATFDPSGLYRMRAVLAWLTALDLSAAQIHAHARALGDHLLLRLEPHRLPGLTRDCLVTPMSNGAERGNFLAFSHPHSEENERRLLGADIVVDRRGDRLRLGFGCYHTLAAIDAAADAIVATLR